MATIAAHSEPRRAPAIAGFGQLPRSFPLRPGRAMSWALVVLGIANIGRVPVLSTGNGAAAIVLNDIVVVSLVSLFLVGAAVRRSLLLDAPALFAVAFAAVGFSSAVAARSEFGMGSFQLLISLSYLARWLVYFGVYLFVINNVGPSQVSAIWRSMEKVVLAFAAFGVFQSIFLPDFALLMYPNAREYVDWDPQGHRLVSTVLDPNIAAAMILLVLFVQLAQIASGSRMQWWKPGLLVVGLALTLSRSGLAALLAGVFVIVLARGISIRLIKLFSIILFFAIALLPKLIGFAQAYGRFDFGKGTSAGTRVMAWLLSLETIMGHPIAGVGFNTYGFVKESAGMTLSGSSSYGADGGLLFVAVMTGILGLSLYLGMLGSVIRRCRRIWRDTAINPEWRGLAIGAAAGIVAICVHSVFANSMFTTFVMELMWVLWGLTFVMDRNRRSLDAIG